MFNLDIELRHLNFDSLDRFLLLIQTMNKEYVILILNVRRFVLLIPMANKEYIFLISYSCVDYYV